MAEKAEVAAKDAPETATKAAAAADDTGLSEAAKKRKRRVRPGMAPPRGRRKRQELSEVRRRIREEGAVSVARAVARLKEVASKKFDQSVEVHMSLGIDPKQADQMVRSTLVLPHGLGKSVRVLVFAQGDAAEAAKAAGADHVGGADLAEKIKAGWTDFDAAIAAPDMMGVVGPLGRVLGPRGLMPSPRAGTVTPDVARVVKEFKAGKVEFRADAGGNVHSVVGKLSFPEERLVENIEAFINHVRAIKPPAAKGQYIKSITVSATHSPGIPVAA